MSEQNTTQSEASYEEVMARKPKAADAKPGRTYEEVMGIKPKGYDLKDLGRDVAATATKAAIAVPEAAVGLADIPTGGRVGKALEDAGVRFKEAKEIANTWHSDSIKRGQQDFAEADGVVGKLGAVVRNPGLIATAVGESLPSMFAGGVAARGGLAAAKGLGLVARPAVDAAGKLTTAGAATAARQAVVAGAAGEGAMMAGAQASAIRQETDDGLLTPKQAGLAVATGVAGGALGYMGGRVAQRLGIGDADTMLTQGLKGVDDQIADSASRAVANPLVAEAAMKSIPRKVIEGAIAEGFLEELPQSMAETIFQNIALDKPWHEELDSAAVMGILSGGAMGAGAAGFRGFRESSNRAPDGGDAGTGGNPEPVVGTPGGDMVRQAYAEQLLALPAPTISVNSQGVAQTAADRNARLQRLATGDVTDVTPISESTRETPIFDRSASIPVAGELYLPGDTTNPLTGERIPARPSEQMGLRSGPDAGMLEGAAAKSVDTGATGQVQQAALLEEAAARPGTRQAARAPGNVDPETGEILDLDTFDMAHWSDADVSTAFRSAQSKQVRLALAKELSTRRAKREQANDQLTLAINEGVDDGTQTPQTQQGRTQQAQAGAAQNESGAGGKPEISATGLRGNNEPDAVASAGVAEGVGVQPVDGGERNGGREPDGAVTAAQQALASGGTQEDALRAATSSLIDAAPVGGLAEGAQKAVAQAQAAAQDTPEVAAMGEKLRTVEAQMLAKAPGGDIASAMKDKKVPVTLKAQRKKLMDDLAKASPAMAQAEPPALSPAAGTPSDEAQDAPTADAAREPAEAASGVPVAAGASDVQAAGVEGAAPAELRQMAQQFRERGQASDATFARVLDQFAGEIEQGKRTPESFAQGAAAYRKMLAQPPQAEAEQAAPTLSEVQQGAQGERNQTKTGQDSHRQMGAAKKESTPKDIPALSQLSTDAYTRLRGNVTAGRERLVQQSQRRQKLNAEIKAAVKRISAHLGVPVHVADTVADAREHYGRSDIPGDIRGVALGGKDLTLVAENINSLAEAEFVLWHELLHVGLARTVPRSGALYGNLMSRLGASNRNLADTAKRWRDAFGADYVERLVDGGMGRIQALQRMHQVSIEEALADLAGANPNVPWVKQFLAQLQQLIRNMGLTNLADWIESTTNAQALQVIASTRKAVVRPGNLRIFPQFGPEFKSEVSYSPTPGGSDQEKARILQGAPVAVLRGDEAPTTGMADVRRWASDLFAGQGGSAAHPGIGAVTLDERAVRDSMAHGKANPFKYLAFAAVKDVIERGVLVRSATDGNVDSFYVSAPVQIRGVDDIVTVLVRRDPKDQRMYLHSVATKESLLNRRVSGADATKATSGHSGSSNSGDSSTVANSARSGKLASSEVAAELSRLLNLDMGGSEPRSTATGQQPLYAGNPEKVSGQDAPIAQSENQPIWERTGTSTPTVDEGRSPSPWGQSGNASLSRSDDEGNDVAYSRASFSSIKSQALDQIQSALSHPGKASIWDKTVGTMRHLGERVPEFKPVFEAAQRFIDDVSMLANDAADFAPRLMPRVETLADLKKKPIKAADNKAIAKPLFEGTLNWARDTDGTPMTTDALSKKYRDAGALEKAQILLRSGKVPEGVMRMWRGLPMAQFESVINGKFESTILKPGVVWSNQELKTLFGLDDNQASLYREARASIDRSIDMTARTDMLRLLGPEFADMRDEVLDQSSLESALGLITGVLQQQSRKKPDSAERLMQVSNLVNKRFDTAKELMQRGYAPLSRFGKYTVDVVDSEGERQYFGMFESMREANLMAMKMRDVFKGASVKQGTMSEQAHKLFQGITPESLELFGEMLGLHGDGDEAKDKAFQTYLQLAKNNHSALKRLIHRKGIDGYSEDVGRVLASFVYSNARLGAQGLNAGTMEAAIKEIPKEMGEIRDLAVGLRSYIQDPQEEGQAIRGMLFAQYLGGSIASAFVNMTQPFQITTPWLSQYGGMRKAASQMARALKDMMGGKYEPDLAQALKAAEADGVVSPQEVHQLMAQARGTGSLRTGDGARAGDARAALSNNWERIKVGWGQPFALAEQFNRRSTFIAAYRTAKDQDIPNPAEFARKAVLETQFVYSKANKMRWGRGAVGGTLMTFKTYSVSYLELMQRMWTQGGREGKRAVGWSVAILLLMSGAGGLPFMEDAEDLIDGAGQLMGYNISAKQWRKELLRDVVGKELSDFVEQGVSGLPGAPVDVSGRLGMGNLIPGTGLFLNKQNRERDLMEIAGPAGDLVARGFTGARKALTGDVAGAALEVSPTAVRNWAKGYDMAVSGIYKDTKGYKVIDTTLAEAVSKFGGFQPKSVAEVQEANSFMQRSRSFYTQTSSEIKAGWAQAIFDKDDAALKRVRARLDAWNRNNPDQRIVVRMPDVWKRVREMGKDRTQRIADTSPKALRAQMREIAAEASR